MQTTVGIIIFDTTGKILIAKPTNGNIWSFPKGLQDEGETLLETGLRETLEETSLDLTKIKGVFDDNVYEQVYKTNKKIVHLFIFKSSEPIEGVYELECTTSFEFRGKTFLENDKFEFIEPENCFGVLHEAQAIILRRHLNI